MQKMIYFLFTCLFASSLCFGVPVENTSFDSPQYDENKALNIWGEGNRHFTASFYKQAVTTGHNVIFSPVSLQLALSLSAEIATGATQRQIIDKAFLQEGFIRKRGAQAIIKQFNSGVSIGGEPISLILANRGWLSSDYSLSKQAKRTLRYFYKTRLKLADFHSSPEESRLKINSWIGKKTNELIQDLIAPGVINQGTRLVLVNTLYMRAPWLTPFEEENTYEDQFYGLEKSLIPISYMQRRGYFNYRSEELSEVIELPFQPSTSTASNLSLLVVLPKEGHLLEEVELGLSPLQLQQWLDIEESALLDLHLPKCKVSSSMNATDLLKNLGMDLPFSPENAEFGEIQPVKAGEESEKIFITDVIHNAVFEIDETGGMGSAATAIICGTTAFLEATEVKVNRPFLIFVVDKTSGSVLFAGRVMQPKA